VLEQSPNVRDLDAVRGERAVGLQLVLRGFRQQPLHGFKGQLAQARRPAGGLSFSRRQAELEAVEQDGDGAQSGVEKLLPVGLDPDAVAEKFEQDPDQLFRVLGVLHGRQPPQHDLQASTIGHHVGKFEDFFFVLKANVI